MSELTTNSFHESLIRINQKEKITLEILLCFSLGPNFSQSFLMVLDCLNMRASTQTVIHPTTTQRKI